MEFVMFVVMAFMIMVVFAAVVRDRHVAIRNEAEYTALKDVVNMVQAEILLASAVQDDYYREFKVPGDIEGLVFTLIIQNDFIIADSPHHNFQAAIPPVIGNVTIGDNSIQKQNGLVYLNS